jgi:uncharacterized phage-associated protein
MKPTIAEFLAAYHEEDGPIHLIESECKTVDTWRHGHVNQLIFHDTRTDKYWKLLNRQSADGEYNSLSDGDVDLDYFKEVKSVVKTIYVWENVK